jgi:hypothetical protein
MVKLSDLKANKKNPRNITEANLAKLKESIQNFPQMMALRPIIINKRGTILGGNMRHKALTALGWKEIPDDWVKTAEELTPDDEKRFIIEDNLAFGEWDMSMLNEDWDTNLLSEWGLETIKPFDGDIDSFFDTESEPKAAKEIICPHCGRNINEE